MSHSIHQTKDESSRTHTRALPPILFLDCRKDNGSQRFQNLKCFLNKNEKVNVLKKGKPVAPVMNKSEEAAMYAEAAPASSPKKIERPRRNQEIQRGTSGPPSIIIFEKSIL